MMARGQFVIRDCPDGDLLARLDALVLRLKRRHPGRALSRESLARELLYRATGRPKPPGGGAISS